MINCFFHLGQSGFGRGRFGLGPVAVMSFVILGWISILPGNQPAQDRSPQSDTEITELAQGLRTRRLFDLAETYCRERLEDPELDATTQASLILELIRTQTSRAAVSSGPQRIQSWAAAKQTAQDFSSKHPLHPRLLLVQVQLALTHLTHGRLIRQEIQADIAPASTRDKALAELREATSAFNEIQRTIRKRTPEIRGRTLSEHELSVAQLTALNNNVRLQSAICGINRAQLYPPGDQLNRIDALNGALEKLNAVRRESNSEHPLWWQTELQRAKCFRLLNKFQEGQDILSKLPLKQANLATKQQVIEQQIRLLIDSGNLRNGPQIISQVGQIANRTPQLDLATIELMMRLAKQGDGQWRSKAAEQLGLIESHHGGYWGRRAELLVIGAAGMTDNTNVDHATDPGSLDLLIRIGEQALRKNRLDDALKAFGQAIENADSQKKWPVLFSATVKKSQVLEKLKDHEAASHNLIDLANRFQKSEYSPAAHLRGCWNYGQIVEADPALVAERKQTFLRLLQENIAQWPATVPADQARYWAARHLQSQKQWHSAIDLYLAIRVDSRLFPNAIDLSAACVEAALLASPNSNDLVKSYIRSLLQSLGRDELTADGVDQVLLALARTGLTRSGLTNETIGVAELEDRLRGAAVDSAPETRRAIQSWLIVAVAAQGKPIEDIVPLIAEIGDDEPAFRQSASAINSILKRIPEAPSTTLLETKLEIATHILGQNLSNSGQTYWMGESADALLGLGRNAEAVNTLSDLAKRLPKSAEAQMQFARGLSRISGEDAVKTAITQWRRVARQLRPQTENWFEAKYNIATCMKNLGDKGAVLKLLEYLKAIPPGWSNSEWKPKFEKLLIECQN